MVYLNAATPAWSPADEAELVAAIAGGLLAESHHLDLKQEIGTSRGANTELARDVAAMAIDGGSILIGIAEDKETRTVSRHPVPLAGLAERIDQVARTLITPRLALRTRDIPNAEDSTQGYLLVNVPVSAQAPHMVDGRYYGRNDREKYPLSDAEVARLIARRAELDQGAALFLAQFVNDDPWVASEWGQQHAHLFLVARPAPPTDGFLERAAGRFTNPGVMTQIASTPPPGLHEALTAVGGNYLPDVSDASRLERRARGIALVSYNVRAGRPSNEGTEEPLESHSIDLAFDEDGALRWFCGNGSMAIGIPNREPQEVLFEALIVGLLRRQLAVAVELSNRAGYLGAWDLGIALTRLRDVVSYGRPQTRWFGQSSSPFTEDEYRQTTRSDVEAMCQVPWEIAKRLCGRLFRAVGSEVQMRALLEPPPGT